ncbi:PIN-like domain-containing protein [Polaribacter sp. SA4-12]|uniref:PIN-like domain-containing protein n=1 Tax=Polaribacter sp. SA4-12 TaxID=1312072 RepID=UPI0012F89403|nr:PIN-like domain-containing protein [Polaribacter sp. SA4-12]
MELLKKIHRNNKQIDFKSIWNKGTFIFDSNVLLDLYRLPISAREDLFSVFQNEKFKDRIWIGFQVLLEFLNNRLEVISDQKNKFNQVKKLVESTISEYEESNNTLRKELNNLKLAQRHSLIEPEKYIKDKNFKNSKNFLKEFIEYLDKLEEKQFDVNEDDIIKEKVLEIFKNNVGISFDQESLENIYKEGEERYKNQVPPGYMDGSKKGFYPYENKNFKRKYGDLLLWKEIIEKCKKEKTEYAVLVTGDIKEDWWQKKRGKKLGARMELLNEIYSQATDLDTFYMYDTSSFLQYAKLEIDENIKDSSISETKELIELSSQERLKIEKEKSKLRLKNAKIDFVEIQNKISSVKKEIEKIKEYQNKVSNTRTNIYLESDENDEIKEYAHNLGYLEAEQDEELKRLNENLKQLEKYKSKFILDFYKKRKK